MSSRPLPTTAARLAACAASTLMALGMAACSHGNASSQDQSLTTAIQSKINADPALQGSGVNATVLNGVATLTGAVASDAARNAAQQDAQIPGVTQVNNQIGTNTTMAAAAPAPSASTPPAATTAMQAQPQANPPAATAPAPNLSAASPVEVESGTTLHVRLGRSLSSADASEGQPFDGTLSSSVLVNGQVAIPKGATVSGHVTAADSAGHFKGQSRLAVTLDNVSYNGQTYDLHTHAITRLAASRSTRSEEAIGGGTAVGALIGALAGHGKGAAIGAISGAGAGTAAQALTKPAEVTLPADTVLRFTLSSAIQVVPAGSNQ